MSDEFKDWPRVLMKLSDLKVAEYNPRKITKKAFKGLKSSLDYFGRIDLIVYNEKTGNIVGGHQRYQAMVEAGEEEDEVIMIDVSEDEEIAINVALNNEKIRGYFTGSAVEVLEDVEDELQEAFANLRLDVLKEKVEKQKIKEETPKEKKDGGIDVPKMYAVITCPKCEGEWRQDNSEVIKRGKNVE